MNYFLQFKPNKKEPWRMFTEEQLKNELPEPPAFQTVLKVDQDPQQVSENDLNPLDVVKYLGPMYLDFDDAEDIDRVLVDVNAVLDYLMNKLDIPEKFIHCWLSGGKGVHITIPGQIFGVKTATKWLPMIYREIMLSIEQGAGIKYDDSTLDHGVYSCGRGRMWRCEGIARPGTGAFKVGTTVNELSFMDSEDYQVACATARGPLATPEPDKGVSFLKAEQLFKAAKVTAGKKVRALKETSVVPRETLQAWEGIPGCVKKLITEGDTGESNWNQGAMQLASYIAARYEKEDTTYIEDLVKPFCRNVESSSRPSESERFHHVQGQLVRTFRGEFKFAPGAFIAVIGTPCGQCPVCRSDLASGDADQEGAQLGDYNPHTKISHDAYGYWLVGETGRRQLTTFTFWPDTEVHELIPATVNGMPAWKESGRQELRGYLIDDEGKKITDIRIPERAWSSKRDLIAAFKGQGDSLVYCSDAETQKLLKSVLTFAREKSENKELERMTRANVCGIVFDRSNPKKTVPHYVEADSSITSLGGRSPYRFNGNPRQSPALLSLTNPYENDDELETAIAALTQVNFPVEVAKMLGFFVACHFREHIQFDEPQFPLLNISGNAEAGKTSLAILMAMINGIDYSRAEFQNVEVGSKYPLIKFVSSSTTVPRLIEEVNPVQLGPTRYGDIVSILKASWNRAPIQRGSLKDRGLEISEDRVSAPLVYTSEQSSTVPSLRSRSIEVHLQAKALQVESHVHNYHIAMSKRGALLRMARALVTVAMGTSPAELKKIFDSKGALIHKNMKPRPRWGMQTCLTGLHMLMHTMDEFKVGGRPYVQRLYDELVTYLGGQVMESERGKSSSEVDRVISVMNTLADETFEERFRLDAGKHYWRTGNKLHLVLQSCLPRYIGYMRSISELAVIKDFNQLCKLLEGEVYFDHTSTHPARDVQVFTLDMEKLSSSGTTLNNFNESTVEEV